MTRKSLVSIAIVLASLALSAAPAIAGGPGDDLPSVAWFSDAEPDGVGTDRSLPSTALFSASGPHVPSDRLPSAALLSDATALPAPDTAGAVGSPVASGGDGFDWGDALIGTAVGLALAGTVGAAYVAVRRRRPTVQPSV